MIEDETVWLSIARLAEIRGLSLYKLAIEAGYSHNALTPAKWQSEYGQWRSPRVATIIRLCELAGVSLDEWARIVQTIQQEKDAK